jgi:hypothetical protein
MKEVQDQVREISYSDKGSRVICRASAGPVTGPVGPVNSLWGSCPTDNELSAWVKRGRFPLESVYVGCYCPGGTVRDAVELVAWDVPNNDLGVTANARALSPASANVSARGDLNQPTAPLSSFVQNFAAVDLAEVDVLYGFIGFPDLYKQPFTVRMRSTGIVDGSGNPIGRDVTLRIKRPCEAVEIWLPLASPMTGANVWGPASGRTTLVPDASSIIISGAPSGAPGTIATAFVGPYHNLAPEFAATILNWSSN